MTDNELPTGTTDDATGTTAPAADGSASKADGSGVDDVEALRKQLNDLQRKNEQLLSEKSNVERERQELERQRQSIGQATPPTQTVDPYVHQMQLLTSVVLRYGEDSYEGMMARAQMVALQKAAQAASTQDFMVQIERDLLAIPVEHRDDVKRRIYNGEFASVGQAYEAVKGSRSGQTIEALQRELEDLKRRMNGGAPRVADVSTSIRTQVDAATHKKNMSLADYQRIMDAGGPQAERLLRQVDDGNVSIDY